MRILALETATYFGGVALINRGTHDAMGPFAPRESSKEVLHAAYCLLQRNGIGLDELELVAVSTGPGLFTGVRIGLSIAKTLCWGKPNLPIVAIPTLEAVASLVLQSRIFRRGDQILAITDARRGEVYAAAFEHAAASEYAGASEPGEASETGSLSSADGPFDNPLLRLYPDLVIRPNHLRAHLANALGTGGTLWMVGDGLNRYPEAFAQQFPEAQVHPHEQPNLAIQVAMLGQTRFRLSGGMNPTAVQPHYVRRPDARLPTGPFLSAGSLEP